MQKGQSYHIILLGLQYFNRIPNYMRICENHHKDKPANTWCRPLLPQTKLRDFLPNAHTYYIHPHSTCLYISLNQHKYEYDSTPFFLKTKPVFHKSLLLALAHAQPDPPADVPEELRASSLRKVRQSVWVFRGFVCEADLDAFFYCFTRCTGWSFLSFLWVGWLVWWFETWYPSWNI